MRTAVLTALVFGSIAAAALALRAAQEKPAPNVVRASRFELVDAEGRTRAVLGVSKSGSPEFDLRDAHGRPRALMVLDADSLPILLFKDADVITRAKLELDAKGGAKLTFCDADLAPRIEVDGKPQLRVLNPKGDLDWKAP
jgi:hypothetical protein